MHSMSSLSLAWHWQFGCVHVHSMSQSGIVCSWRMLAWLPAFVNVEYLVFLLACSV